MTLTITIVSAISCPATGFGKKPFVFPLLLQVSLTNYLCRTLSLRILIHTGPCSCQLYWEVTRQLSLATGHNQYWPVYMSIGNIHNNTRRAHRNGVILLGFLAIPKCKS